MSSSSESGATEPAATLWQAWALLARYRSHLVLGALLLVATNGFALGIPYLLGRIVDALTEDRAGELIPPLALAMVCLAIAQALTRVGSRIALFNSARNAEHDLRSRLFRHLLILDGTFFSRTSTGDLMSRLINDVQTVRAMWGPGILNLINTAFVFATALTLMIRIDPVLTVLAVVPYPSMVIVGRLFGRRMYRYSRDVQERLGELSSSLQEDLSGMGVIKTYALEEPRRDQFQALSEKLRDSNMELVQVRGQLTPALSAISALSAVIVLYVGGRRVIDPNIPLQLGELVEFNGYLALLVWPTLALGWMISLLQRGKASWQRLHEFLIVEPGIRDGDGPPLEPSSVRGKLEVRNLHYSVGERTILNGVSFEVPAGTTTAIVGRTGSGKSSLVELIPRMLDTPPGAIFLDDRDITTLPLANLRQIIGYAPQNAFLFSRSIAANIGFAAPAEQVPIAARAAGLTRDLEVLPDGLDTVVGERGITLSGGQRQRVALARALAPRPPVLLLDDSLSSVDAHTEREILEHLKTYLEGRTALIISHRVAAVRAADEILVLDEGRVAERGKHGQLLAAGGIYSQLYRDQLTEDALTEVEDPRD